MADAHPGAADKLLLDQPRVQSPPQFVGAIHPDHRDFAGLVVDLDLGDEAGVRVTGRGRHLPGLGIDRRQRHEENAAPGNRPPLLELGRDGDVLGRNRAVRRALDMDGAAPVRFEVGDIDLELLGRRLHHHGAGFARGRRHRIADPVRAA